MHFELVDADPPKDEWAGKILSSDAERNKHLVVQFFELAYHGRAPGAAIDRFTSPSYVQHGPEGVRSHEGFIAAAKAFTDQHPAIKLEIRRVIAEGPYVVLQVIVIARSPTSTHDLTLVDIFRVEKGRIVEQWDVPQGMPAYAAAPKGMA